MYNSQTIADTNTTLQIKANELVPSIETKQESLFDRVVDSGYTATINTPVLRNNKNAIVGVNLCGFIPDFTLKDPYWSQMQRNMAAVQAFPNSANFVHIEQDMQILPVMHAMYSHRLCSGTINVILRISSNTSQTGNIIISQQSGLIPKLYTVNENYQGARFQNDGHYTADPMICNFTIPDVSLIRQVGIRTVFRQPVEVVDIQKKIFEFSSNTPPSVDAMSQFPEDWLMIGIVSNLPDSAASQLYIRFLFDYSEVSFIAPMYPMMPAIPHNPSQQILQYSRTFVGTTGDRKEMAYFLPIAQTTFSDRIMEAYKKMKARQEVDEINKRAKDLVIRETNERIKHEAERRRMAEEAERDRLRQEQEAGQTNSSQEVDTRTTSDDTPRQMTRDQQKMSQIDDTRGNTIPKKNSGS